MPKDSHLEEGKPGYLHCHAQANLQPEVTWFRSSNIIQSEVGFHFPHCLFLLTTYRRKLVCLYLHSFTKTFCLFFLSHQDIRFKIFPNGTLRINNVEVYDAHVYSCQTKTLGGQLTGYAKVAVLGKMRGNHLADQYIQWIILCLLRIYLKIFPGDKDDV